MTPAPSDPIGPSSCSICGAKCGLSLMACAYCLTPLCETCVCPDERCVLIDKLRAVERASRRVFTSLRGAAVALVKGAGEGYEEAFNALDKALQRVPPWED